MISERLSYLFCWYFTLKYLPQPNAITPSSIGMPKNEPDKDFFLTNYKCPLHRYCISFLASFVCIPPLRIFLTMFVVIPACLYYWESLLNNMEGSSFKAYPILLLITMCGVVDLNEISGQPEEDHDHEHLLTWTYRHRT